MKKIKKKDLAKLLSQWQKMHTVFVPSKENGTSQMAPWDGQDTGFLERLETLPRRIGVVSQTTQVPQAFQNFIHRLIDLTFGQDSEVWCVDTICHDIRQRQAAALELARRVDLMLVVGGRNSANTRHLAALCGEITATHHITDASEVIPSWFGDNVRRAGIVGGASTPEAALAAVRARLLEIAGD